MNHGYNEYNTMNLHWNDSYRIGDERIDAQHQNLFELANAMLAASSQPELRLCAMKLYQHVRSHFADEEALMQKVGFPQYREHVESHNRVLQGLSAISQDIGTNTVDPAIISAFLQGWGLRHIPQEDALIARYVLNPIHPAS